MSQKQDRCNTTVILTERNIAEEDASQKLLQKSKMYSFCEYLIYNYTCNMYIYKFVGTFSL